MPTKGKPRARRGEVVNYETPNWEPLLKLARIYVGEFMWMHEVELRDGTRIHAYKHYWTRRYLHLDGEKDRAFLYSQESRYRELDEEELLRQFDLAVGRRDPALGIPGYTGCHGEGDGLDA